MAKQCAVCQRPYPDDQASCPYCAAAAEGLDAAAFAELARTEPTDTGRGGEPHPAAGRDAGDSMIDLGLPPAEAAHGGSAPVHSDPSVASSVPWASLVEDEPQALPEPARFDSPSDADLLLHAGLEPPGGPGSASDVDLGAHDRPVPGSGSLPSVGSGSNVSNAAGGASTAGVDSGSHIDLSGEVGSGSGSGSRSSDDAADDGHALADDAAATAFMSGAEVTGTHAPAPATDLAGAAGAPGEAGPDSASHVRLGEEPRRAGSGHSSGVDLRDLDLADDAAVLEGLTEPAGGPDEGASADSGIDLAVEGMPPDAEDDAVDYGERRDPIAEAVESGVDLGLPPGGPRPEGTGMTDLGAAGARSGSRPDVGADDEAVELGTDDAIDLTSAVNLGGSPLTHVHTPEELSELSLMGQADAPPPPRRPVRKPAPSEVDLGARDEDDPAHVWTSGSSLVPPAVLNSGSNIDLGGDAGSGSGSSPSDEPEPEPAGAVAVEVPGPAAAPKPSRPKTPVVAAGRGSAWAGGTVLGVVLGSAASLALWFAGVEPPGEWRGTPKAAPAGPGAAARVQGLPVAGPAAKGATARELLNVGNFAAAAEAGIERVEGDDPAQLVDRGELRWLTYLQKQRLAGAPIKADDPSVKEATADLEKAAAKGDARALFDLGQLQESADELDKARATYTKGAEAFKDKPRERRIFEAALNRLDLRAGDKSVGLALPADEAGLLALAVVALLVPQPPAPAGGADAAEADEAGFEFWQAAKLARSGKYGEAVQALNAARKLHDRGRFARLRKAQNPLSDPTEEIFLRACDELKAYWQLEERLRAGGYLASGRDPVKAVDALVAKAKEAGNAPAGPDTKALADKLVSAKVIDKPEDLASGVDRLLKARQEAADLEAKARQERETSEKAVAKARGDADKAAKALAEAEEAAKGNDAKWKEAQAALERTKKQLDDLAAREDPVVRKSLDELAKANFVNARAGKEELLDGVRGAIQAARATDSQDLVRKLQADLARTREQVRRAEADAAAAAERPRERPATGRVETAYAANPLAAEQHYTDGLAYYFARRYPEAERALAAAVADDDLDARFHYFLGLAQLLQGKDAAAELRRGAALEGQGRPPRAAVDAALERVQGDARRTVDDARK
jgi:hypothetical protein